jgi:hypothetical protein
MRFKSLRLSPHLHAKFSGYQSVGLASGDLPFVVMSVGGSYTQLNRGQILPTGGEDVTLINVLSRTGQCTVVFDMEPTIGRVSGRDYDYSDEYHVDTLVDAAGADTTTGIGIMPKTGSLHLLLNSSLSVNMVLYPDIKAENLVNKPAGFMDASVAPVMSTIGNTYNNAEIILGSYTEAQAAAWIVASEYTAQPMYVKNLKSGTFEIRAGTAVFFVSESFNQKFDASFRIRDLGAGEIERVV